MKSSYLIYLPVLISFFISCSQPEESSFIRIPTDLKDIISYDLEKKAAFVIPLENSDSAILANVLNLQFVGDTIVILSRNKVAVFDFKGNLLHNIGKWGRGPDEFQDMTHMFVKNNHIFISDMMSHCIREYDLNGKLYKTHPIMEKNGIISGFPHPFTNSPYYLSRNLFRGVINQTPELSLLDSNFRIVKTNDRLKLKSGILIYNNFCQSMDGNTLYWQFLNDTIYHIDTDLNVRPHYYVDFGTYQIPQAIRQKYPDVYDIIDYTNKNCDRVAGMIDHVYETPEFLSCRFFFNKNVYTLKYDKKKKVSKIYNFSYGNEEYRFEPLQKKYKNYFVQAAVNLNEPNQNFKLFFFEL